MERAENGAVEREDRGLNHSEAAIYEDEDESVIVVVRRVKRRDDITGKNHRLTSKDNP